MSVTFKSKGGLVTLGHNFGVNFGVHPWW